MINIIVAKSRNGVIGAGNTIPWHLPEDLQHFKTTTQGSPIIMGRLTWESLPRRPLPGRRNMVITSRPEDIHLAESFPCLTAALDVLPTESPVFIIGGERLYHSAMGVADRIIVSEVDLEITGDRYFPEIDEKVWTEMSRVVIPTSGIPFEVVTYERLKNYPMLGTD